MWKLILGSFVVQTTTEEQITGTTTDNRTTVVLPQEGGENIDMKALRMVTVEKNIYDKSKGPFIYDVSHFGEGVNQILTFADRRGRGGWSKCDILLTLALNERKNEVNGLNHEVNQDILFILFS